MENLGFNPRARFWQRNRAFPLPIGAVPPWEIKFEIVFYIFAAVMLGS
jgi:hypothetical protein